MDKVDRDWQLAQGVRVGLHSGDNFVIVVLIAESENN